MFTESLRVPCMATNRLGSPEHHRAPWPSAARRGEARPVLGRRSKLERDLKEGEAELRARGIGEWRGGAGV